MANSEFEETYLRRIILSGNIGERGAISFLKQISVLEHLDPNSPIEVWISSFGGSVCEALLIHDAIKACSCEIKVVVIGKAMSCAVLLLAAGDEGNRFVAPNARLMIHSVSAGSFGTSKDIEIFSEEIKFQQDQFFSLLSFYTGIDKKELLKDVVGDKYFGAEEAVARGFADHILPYAKNKKAPKIIVKKALNKKVVKKK